MKTYKRTHKPAKSRLAIIQPTKPCVAFEKPKLVHVLWKAIRGRKAFVEALRSANNVHIG